MAVHIIRVLREFSDRSARQSAQTERFFCKDINNMQAGQWEPNTDIYESEHEVIVRVELAGVDKENVSVRIKDSRLHIRGVRQGYQSPDRIFYHQVELHCGEFSKTIALPDSIAHNDIAASFQNGILEIRISKQDQAIEIPIGDDVNMNQDKI